MRPLSSIMYSTCTIDFFLISFSCACSKRDTDSSLGNAALYTILTAALFGCVSYGIALATVNKYRISHAYQDRYRWFRPESAARGFWPRAALSGLNQRYLSWYAWLIVFQTCHQRHNAACKYRTRAIMVRYLRPWGNNGCNAAKCRAWPVNHAPAVSALIGSILDNDHEACLNMYILYWKRSTTTFRPD